MTDIPTPLWHIRRIGRRGTKCALGDGSGETPESDIKDIPGIRDTAHKGGKR